MATMSVAAHYITTLESRLVSLRHTNISDVTLAFRVYEMWQGVTGIWIVRKKRKDDRVAETNEVVIG